MNIMFLLAVSLTHIAYAKMSEITIKNISCDSTQYGSLFLNYTSQSFEPAYFTFELLTNSYVEISTCGSFFDTYLHLYGGGDVHIMNDDGCGLNAVINSNSSLKVGQYFIKLLMPSPLIPAIPGYGTYKIALQCDPYDTPTIPHSTAIPVESDCNFFFESKLIPVQPLDVCSVQVSGVFSRKYTCNSKKDGVIIMHYNSSDCTGYEVPNEILGEGSTYYFNCDGSNDKCNLGTVEMKCVTGKFQKLTVVVDQCVDGRQILCDNGRIGMAEYVEDDCTDLVNISYASGLDNDNCKIRETCESFPQFPETSMVFDECYGGCDVGFVCCDDECVRDCDLFAIDDYLLQCSKEFDRNDQDIEKLQNKIDKQQDKIGKLKQELINVNLRIDAFEKENKKKKSDIVPFLSLTQPVKDIMFVMMFIINVLVVMYLLYDKRMRDKTQSYVNVKEYVDEEEMQLHN